MNKRLWLKKMKQFYGATFYMVKVFADYKTKKGRTEFMGDMKWNKETRKLYWQTRFGTQSM